MDVLERATSIIIRNYALKKNRGVSLTEDLPFNNFVSTARLSVDYGSGGLVNNDLARVFCDALNSVLMRSGRPILSGGMWDMPPAFISGYVAMGIMFDQVWNTKVAPGPVSTLYKFVDNATASAGFPVCTPLPTVEVTPLGIRLCSAAVPSPYVINLEHVLGIGVIRELGFYAVPANPGNITINDVTYSIVSGGASTSRFRYTPFMGEERQIIHGVPFNVNGGSLRLLGNTAGCFDIDMHLRGAFDDVRTIQPIPVGYGSSYLSYTPDMRTLPAPFADIWERFQKAYLENRADECLITTVPQKMGEAICYICNAIAEQLSHSY